MKALDIPKSGKHGNTVAFKSRFGQCERAHVSPRKPRTDAQLRAQTEFGDASLGYNHLTDEQRHAWCAYGKKVRSHPRGGQSGPLTGQNLYTAINRNQRLLGLPLFSYPPERPIFDPNPVAAFRITQGRDGIALKLSVTAAPAGHILLYASRPYNAARRYCDKFIYLGTLPAAVRGESNITEKYLRKQPPPWPGSRIFIRMCQQVNGWRDLPHRIEAVFHPAPAAATSPKRRHAAVSTS